LAFGKLFVSVHGTLKLENRNWKFGLNIFTTDLHGNFTDIKIDSLVESITDGARRKCPWGAK
jgi:hypothetical protein